MPCYLISTDNNTIGHVQVDATNGELTKMTTYRVAPNPDELPGKSPGGISTQWLVRHPTLPLVIALTSYWNTRPAHLSCFQLHHDDDGDEESVSLTKLEGVECSTRGREAVYAVFSPCRPKSDHITLAVAHHNDGLVSFFSFSTQEMPTSKMEEQPTMTLQLPEIIKGSRQYLEPGANMGLSVPSSHHIVYDRLGKYMWIVDPNQSAVFTYECNPQTGLPTKKQPSSVFKCHTDTPTLSWFGSIVNNIMGLSCRPRRIALSPNGEYAFILYETRNTIQVYGVNPKTGGIDTACLQEVRTLDPNLLTQPFVGLTIQAAAEMVVYNNSLYVSNQGCVFAGVGQGENSIRVFSIRDGGRLARNPKSVRCKGPVRHFTVSQQNGQEILVAGTCQAGGKRLQTFVRDVDRSLRGDKPNDFRVKGDADVRMNLLCVVSAEKTDGIPEAIDASIEEEAASSKGERRGSLIASLQEKYMMERLRREQLEETITQMEEAAMQSFRYHEDDGVLVEAEPEEEA